MSPELVAAVAGAILSLALELFPGLRTLWDKLPYQYKPIAIFVLCMATPYVLAALACGQIISIGGAVCPSTSVVWYQLLVPGFVAYLSNQATFKYVSKDNGVKFLYGAYIEKAKKDIAASQPTNAAG